LFTWGALDPKVEVSFTSSIGSKLYTKDELEKAWKKMALLYHPDKYHNSDPEVYRVMNEKFVQAKEIYEFLLNKIK
jgi:DnaJ-class molecular chaperone